jgi:4-hydroxy-tetrahydrodipicolinate synthase
MNHKTQLAGVYAAAVTPLTSGLDLDREGLLNLLGFVAGRGCHGVVLMGTTGEGPSLSLQQRISILEVGAAARLEHPGLRLIAGTGTPALEDTAVLNRKAFDLGYDAVLVLPPYYFGTASETGIVDWFKAMVERSVPADGAVLGYHIPGVSGMHLTDTLVERLVDALPNNFVGLKDSSASPEQAANFGARFGAEMTLFNGTDSLLTEALSAGAAGCITALANLASPDLRQVWDAHQRGATDASAQARLVAGRRVVTKYPPAAALLKSILTAEHGFSNWAVMPPLTHLDDRDRALALNAWRGRGQLAA